MATLDELLQQIGLDVSGPWSLGSGGVGPGMPAMSLPADIIQQGQEAMLGTINGAQLAREASRTSTGVITPYVNEELLTQLLTQPVDTTKPTKENDYYIPEATDAELQADWVKKAAAFRASGGKEPNDGWTEVANGVFKKLGVLNEKTGSIGNQYTNVKGKDGVPTMTPPLDIDQVARPENALLGANLSARIDTIRRAPDSRTKVELYQQLQVDAAQQEASILEEIQKQASLQAGVPAFEERVAFNSARDKQHPNWQIYRTDSKETLQARQELDKARLRASQEAQRMAGTNVRLAALSTQVKALKPLIDFDLKAEDRKAAQEDRQAFTKEQAAANAQMRKEEKQAQQEDKLEQAKAAVLAQTSPEKRARLAVIDPSALGKTDDELALMLVKGWSKLSDQDKDAIQAPPEQLLGLSMDGNEAAARVFMREEAQRSGRSVEEVGKELTSVRMLAKDAKVLDSTAMQLLGGADSPDFKAYKSAKQTAIMPGAKKEDIAAFERMKQGLVVSRLQGVAQSKFVQDLSSWQITDPSVKAAYDKAVLNGGAKDLVTVARLAVSEAPAQEKARLFDSFAKEIRANAGSSNSLLGRPNPDAAISMVQAELTKSRWATIKDAVVRTGEGTMEVYNAPYKAGLEFLFGSRK